MPRLLALLVVVPALAAAQVSAPSPVTSAPDSVFLRAQRLVSEGRGSAGRALVDSVLAARTDGSTPYAEALFWRASLAASAVDAERDYRRLAVEFQMSPRSEDALVRLAQMELARGDRAMAVKHLERLALEHPTATARPRASYWMARILFENDDLPGGCTALAKARATVPATDIELRNEVNYLSRRCAGVAIAPLDTTAPALVAKPIPLPLPSAPAVVTSAPPATEPAAAAPPFSVFVPAPVPVPPRPDSVRPRMSADTLVTVPKTTRPSPETQPVFVAASSVSPPSTSPVTTPASTREPAMTPASTREPAMTPAMTPPMTPVTTPATPPPSPSAMKPATAPATTSGIPQPAPGVPQTTTANVPASTFPATPAASSASPTRPPVDTARAKPAVVPVATAVLPRAGRFTVQVAAYDSRPPAEQLAATLVRSGWDARVSGSGRPFRVRIGRYATRADAVAVVRSLEAKKIVAFVAETEP